jgi:hypothetical protein
MEGGIITIAVMLALLPLAALADLFRFFKWLKGPPRPPGPPMTPQALHTLWTCLAAGALAACAYAPFFAVPLAGKTVHALLAEFQHAPLDPPVALVAWAAAAVIGIAYLIVGLHGAAEGPHRGVWAFWSVAVPVISAFVLWRHTPWVWRDPLLRGSCIVAGVVCLTRLYLAVRGDTAERTVRRNIRRKNAPLRPARQRRWIIF